MPYQEPKPRETLITTCPKCGSDKVFGLICDPCGWSGALEEDDNNPMIEAKNRLIEALLKEPVPKSIPLHPHPKNFTDVAEHIHRVAAHLDAWHKAIYEHVKFNSNVRVNGELFDTAFTDAVDGNSTFEVERVGEAL